MHSVHRNTVYNKLHVSDVIQALVYIFVILGLSVSIILNNHGINMSLEILMFVSVLIVWGIISICNARKARKLINKNLHTYLEPLLRKEFPNATYKPNDSDVNPEIFVACRLLRPDVRIGALDYFSVCISGMDVMYVHVHTWRQRSRGTHYTFNGNVLTYRGNTGINGVIRILTINPGALGKYHNFVKFNKNCEMHIKTGDVDFDNLFAIYVSDSYVEKYVLDMLSKEEILDIRCHYSEFAILVDGYHVYIAIPGQEPLLNNLLLTKDIEPEEWLREFRNQVYAIVNTIRDIKDIFIK